MNERQKEQIEDIIYEMSDSFTKDDFLEHYGSEFESMMIEVAKEDLPEYFEDGESLTFDEFNVAIIIDTNYSIIAEEYADMCGDDLIIDETNIKNFMLSQNYFAFTILYNETVEEYKEEYPTPKYMEDTIALYITDESVNELVQALSPDWIYEDDTKVNEACKEAGMTDVEIDTLKGIMLPLEVTDVRVSKPISEITSYAFEAMPSSSTCTDYVQDSVMSDVINNDWFDYKAIVPTDIVEAVRERIKEREEEEDAEYDGE